MGLMSRSLLASGGLVLLAAACSGRVNSQGGSAANAGGSAGNLYGNSGDGNEQTAPLPGAGSENTAGRSPVVGAGSDDAGTGGTGGSDVGGANAKGGANARGGANTTDDAGAGGVANDACDAGNGCILDYGNAVTAMAADDSTLYWVEHGTSDKLGNYNNDGRLMRRDFDSDTAQTVVKGLGGPVGIGLTTAHFFVYLDESFDPSGYTALARIPRAGGAVEIIQRGLQPTNNAGKPCPDCLVHSGSTALFPVADAIMKLTPDDTTPEYFARPGALSMTMVGDFLYLESIADQTGASAVYAGLASSWGVIQAAPTARSYLQASGAYLYGLEVGGPSYLARMPLAGGPWARLAPAQSGVADRLIIAGGFFFYGLDGADYSVIQGSLSDTAKAKPILTVPRKENVKAWLGTPASLFWSDGHSIRQRVLP
jgi:hypothetical protein